jgi:hypothetical protein
MKNKLSSNGFYVFLIPLFYVLHGYNEHFGLIGMGDCLILVFTYLAWSAIIYLIAWLFFRNHLKAALLTGVLIFFLLFFGAMEDFFKAHLFLLSRYMVILPGFFILTCVLFIYLKKTNPRLHKFTFFLNILLIVYLLVDFAGIMWKSIYPNPDKLSIYGIERKNQYNTCEDCKDPDIYFLLFDEYTSTPTLKQTFHYDNSALDSFLLQRGFSIQSYSRGNYNFTPFSMASLLNMNYIRGIKNVSAITRQDYSQCNVLIRDNEVIRFLSSRKYEIINYSIFDLAGNPSLTESSLLPAKARLITRQTFYNRVMTDIGWHSFMKNFWINWFFGNKLYQDLNNNNKILALLNMESSLKKKYPRFVYAHLVMPHSPFYYDKNGKLRDTKTLVAEISEDYLDSYLGYIPYTTSKLKALIDTIQTHTNHQAVIILMGDHGFRGGSGDASHSHYYNNLNAVYFPDKAYSLFTDSITGVNQFRVVFNSLFKQNLPLLKDSSVFLIDHH